MVLAALDLYSFFVEGIFGGLLLTIVGLGILYLIILIMGKLNGITIIAVLAFYIFTVSVLSSSISFFIILIGALLYFMISIIRFFSGGLN